MSVNWFSVPDGEIARGCVGLQDHEGGKGSEHVVGDRQLRSNRILLRFLHIYDELADAQVGLPHFVEAEDEFDTHGPVKAGTILLRVAENRADADSGVEGSRDAQLLDPRRLDVG